MNIRMLLSALLAFGGFAQAQSAAPALSFEVASIRASDPGSRGGLIGADPGIFMMRNITLRRCIEWAYDVKPYQISGPGWLHDVRFDISARAVDRADDDKLHLMLRNLLAD